MRKWVISIVLCVVQLQGVYAPEVEKGFAEYRSRMTLVRFLPFTEEEFIWYLEQQDIPFKDIVISQARLETGNYTSAIFLKGNNLFGMRNPAIRPTKSLGSEQGHAYYSHWTDSVDDYVLWYEYYMHRLDGCYYEFLKGVGYAEDKRYIQKLRDITFRENKNLISLPYEKARFV